MQRKWWTLLAVSVATFMLLLDITVVNTALPAIQEDLNASFTELQWVIDAYTLALAALVLTAGSLADRLGRRRLFAIGLGIFSVSSLAAGLAPDPTFLNIARAIQGIGGAILFAVSLALVAQEFPAGRERGTAMGIYGATIGVSVAVGPLVGGALVDSLGWAWVFFINVPVGIAAIAVTYTKLRESRDPNATSVDWAGLATFSSALFLLVFGLLRGNEEGWGSPFILALLGAAVALLVAFVVIESGVKQPMLPLRLFRKPAFTGVQLAALGVSASMFALFLYITFYLQNHLGHSPLEAGLIYLPFTVISFFAAAAGGALLARMPARVIMSVGLGLTGGGLLLMGGIDPADEWTAHARGLPVGRRGRRTAQPGDRGRGPERGAQGAERHGRRDQRHVPAGRNRRRHRGLGSDLPQPRRVRGRAASGGNARGDRRAPPPAHRGSVVGQPRRGHGLDSRRYPRNGGGRGRSGLHLRAERDRHARRNRVTGRGGRGALAGA